MTKRLDSFFVLFYIPNKDIIKRNTFHDTWKCICKSVTMQDEIILLRKYIVLSQINEDILQVDILFFSFTINGDGIRDTTNTENISVIDKFVKAEVMFECLIYEAW